MAIIFKIIFIILYFILLTMNTIYSGEIELIGAGATFPYPFYSKIFDVYYRQTGIKINYQAIGSGGGIRQLLSQTVDFGGTDAFLTDKELSNAGGEILHIPTVLGAVVLTYNLPENPGLKFTADVVADIFLNKIERWNDKRITDINPRLPLPKNKIIAIHRSDGSGTTFIFSDYLCKVSSEWENTVGRGKALSWPLGLGAKGNPGVAGLVSQIPGAIGYVELIYALQNHMPVGEIQNRSGRFVAPSIHNVSLAADVNLPDDSRISITDTDVKDGYPISGFTWLIFYREQQYGKRGREQAEQLIKLLWWIIHEGQRFAEPLGYAPLPAKAVKTVERALQAVQYNGQQLMK